MGKIIDATYKFLDTLDNSDLIKNLTLYKANLMNNQNLLKEIANIKKETTSSIIIAKRKELYENNDYKMYMKYYNELSFIILKINKKYAEFTNTREHHCHG